VEVEMAVGDGRDEQGGREEPGAPEVGAGEAAEGLAEDDLAVTESWGIPRGELRFRFVRSGGPGGQNVNKVATKAELRFDLSANRTVPEDVRERFARRYASRLTGAGELILASDRYRSQRRNADDCRERLANLLRGVAEPPKPRKATKPSRAAKARRMDEKRRVGDKKRGRQNPGVE
jgi:ribosome-associated protein